MPDQVPVPQQITKTSDFKSAYSNNAQITVTPWDVVFVFGENQTVRDNILHVDIHTRVVMSPQHAKVFSKVLSDNIAMYEEKFGTIMLPTPPDQRTQTENKKPS